MQQTGKGKSKKNNQIISDKNTEIEEIKDQDLTTSPKDQTNSEQENQEKTQISQDDQRQIEQKEEIESLDESQTQLKKRKKNKQKLSLKIQIQTKMNDLEIQECLNIKIDSNEMLKNLESMIINSVYNVQLQNELKKQIYVYLKQQEQYILISAKHNKSLEELGVEDNDTLQVYLQKIEQQNEIQVIESDIENDVYIIDEQEYICDSQQNIKLDFQQIQFVQLVNDNDTAINMKLQATLEQKVIANHKNRQERINYEINLPIIQDNEWRKNGIMKDKEQENLKIVLKYADTLLTNQKIGQDNQDYTCEIINVDTFIPFYKFQISHGEDQNTNLIQIFYPQRYKVGQKFNNQFYCNQQIFRKCTPNGSIKILWVLHNIGVNDEFFNQLNEKESHYIESGVFETIDGMMWKLRLVPGYIIKNDSNQYTYEDPTNSKIQLISLMSESEKNQGNSTRTINSKFSIFNQNNNGVHYLQSEKHWNQEMKFVHGEGESMIIKQIDQFYTFKHPLQMRMNGMFEQSFIHLEIEHLIQKDEQSEKLTNLFVNENQSSDDDSNSNDDSSQSQSVKFKGLLNEGTTCYLNSLFQTLFFIRSFRNAIYRIPTIQRLNQDQNDQIYEIKNIEKLIPFCMQRIFFNLQLGNTQFVRTHELLQAFGWTGIERNQQQDVNEFNCKLSENLESLMQGTYANLFEGKIQNVVKCINIDYESKREEKFLTIQLNVENNFTIEDSIREYISQEKLEGENQYETQKDGKQDARKFIRFIELPPVLQISLNRYKYDIQNGNQIKINQKLEFKEILDLESILPKEDFQNNKLNQVNRYHLHSILVHRGTANAGHYYAFIKPSIDDKWFQFNDAEVTEVTKEYAIGQGVGGNNTEFDLKRFSNKNFLNSSAQLYEKQFHNFANAYMLIYVREAERESIMTDQQNINDLIPKELFQHFKTEEYTKQQIEDDFQSVNTLGDIYLLSQEILQNFQWDGDLLCPKFKNKNQNQNQSNFESNQEASLRLYVDKKISFNEFIVMIKNRFFYDNDDIELEDIWLYRLNQIKKQGKQEKAVLQYVIKQTYNLEEYHDCPLFSKQPQMTNKDLANGYYENRWENIQDYLYRLIVINPLKINPKTGKSYQIIEKISEDQKIEQNNYYNQCIEFVKKTDMLKAKEIINTYQSFLMRAQYKFVDHSIISDVAFENRDQIYMSENQDKQFLSFQNHKNQNQLHRKSFIFKVDKKLKKLEKKKFEQFQFQINNLELQSTQQIEQFFQSIPKQLDENSSYRNQFLIILKTANFQKKCLNFNSLLFFDIRQPIDFKKICEKGEIEYERLLLNHYQIILEPCSYNALQLNQYSDQDSEQKTKKKLKNTDNLLGKGIGSFEQNNGQVFYIITEKVIEKQLPFIEYIDQDIFKQGLTFVIYPIQDNTQLLIDICEEEDSQIDQGNNDQALQQYRDTETKLELSQEQQDLVLKQFLQLMEVVQSRVHINLCHLENNDISQTDTTQTGLGLHQFNFTDSFEEICEKVATICQDLDVQTQNIPQNQLRKHLKFLDNSYNHFTYQEYINYKNEENPKQILKYLLTQQYYLNFMILKYEFKESDNKDEFKFKVYMHDDINHHVNDQNQNQKNFTQSISKVKDKKVNDIIRQYKIINNIEDEFFIPMKIDRQTSTVIKVWDRDKELKKLQTNWRSKSLRDNLNKVFRLQHFSKYEIDQIKEIQNKKEEVVFALFYIYDEIKKQKCGDQFVIPCSQDTTFLEMYKMLKTKLDVIIQNPKNNLDPFDIDSLVMSTILYNHRFSISKNGRQTNCQEYNYDELQIQHKINIIDHGSFTVGKVLLAKSNKGSYQPYGDYDEYKFVYMAALVTFLQDEYDGIMQITANENIQNKKKNIGLNLQNRDSD